MVVFRVLSILHYNCRGMTEVICMAVIQRSSMQYDPRIWSQGSTGDVPASPFSISRQWDVANPRTTTPVFSCIKTFLRTSVSTGFNPLYGFRNLNYCRFRQMEQLLFARTKKEFIYIGFSCHVIQLSPVRL